MFRPLWRKTTHWLARSQAKKRRPAVARFVRRLINIASRQQHMQRMSPDLICEEGAGQPASLLRSHRNLLYYASACTQRSAGEGPVRTVRPCVRSIYGRPRAFAGQARIGTDLTTYQQ